MKEDKLWFYEVDDDYINFLRDYDKKVSENKEEDRKHPRKYIGVVFMIGTVKYLAPLSSYKHDKHDRMKDALDFIKIGNYGVLNLNNMIPIIDTAITKIYFDTVEDEKYKDLLENEYQIIKTKKDKILKNSNILYYQVTKYKAPHLIARCCDFKLLETVSQQYSTKAAQASKTAASNF